MPKVIELTVYTFDELDERIKQRVLEKYRDLNVDDNWWDYTYEDVVRMGAVLGIEIGERTQSSTHGRTWKETDIYFQCNSSQGDGASFAGTYNYKPDAVTQIAIEAPEDKELLRIAQELQVAQVTGVVKYGTSFSATISHEGHSFSLGVVTHDVNDDGSDTYDYEDVHAAIVEAMNDFADWIHKQLVAEQGYQMSDEAVIETIRANEWKFDEDGNRV